MEYYVSDIIYGGNIYIKKEIREVTKIYYLMNKILFAFIRNTE